MLALLARALLIAELAAAAAAGIREALPSGSIVAAENDALQTDISSVDVTCVIVSPPLLLSLSVCNGQYKLRSAAVVPVAATGDANGIGAAQSVLAVLP